MLPGLDIVSDLSTLHVFIQKSVCLMHGLQIYHKTALLGAKSQINCP